MKTRFARPEDRTDPPNVRRYEWLTVQEVAQLARTAPSSVRHWITTGRLRSSRPGRRRLVRSDDLEAFLSNGSNDSHCSCGRGKV